LPPFAAVPPAQVLKCGQVLVQVWPPSWVTAAMMPWAPPLSQRSCWKTPMMLFGFAGLAATNGSTSELG
jgi:hypothetical protein